MIEKVDVLPTSRGSKICVFRLDGCSEQGTVKKEMYGIAKWLALGKTDISSDSDVSSADDLIDFELDEENLEITAICTAKMEGSWRRLLV